MDGPWFDVTVGPTCLHHVYESSGVLCLTWWRMSLGNEDTWMASVL